MTKTSEQQKKKTASLLDIAKRANLSVATVSKVLNNSSGSVVNANTRKKIEEIAKSLNYRRARNARFLADGKTGQITMIMPDELFSNNVWRASMPLTLDIYAGIVSYFTKHKYSVNLMFSPPEKMEDFFVKHFLRERTVDGVVIYSGREELALAQKIMMPIFPVVSFDWRAKEYQIPHVTANSATGISAAVRKILELGHRNVGCIYYNDPATSQHVIDRRDIFIEECRNAGLEIMDDFVCSITDEIDSYRQTIRLFSNRESRKPTVLFYSSDHYAAAGIQALNELGYNVPGNVSVLGYDDAPYITNLNIGLSTVRMPYRELGQKGAELLLQMLEDDASEGKKIKNSVDTVFIERDSIGYAGT